ncbi:MAG: hypothetical protein ABS68_00470 [Niastella sp. SCN 39-18]|nr:glycosyltransferase [Sphingobacteriales bacterium]ODT55009.1 MAG: hypothetical protein ABS68_00470 [Niastella sp. SCN 39-18]
MNILFIRDYPFIDGTFTLLLRQAYHAKKDGHNPYFLFLNKNIETSLLVEVKGICPVYFPGDLSRLKSENNLPPIEVIHGILSGDRLYDCYDTIKAKYFPGAAVVIGFYHPRTFIIKTHGWPSPDVKMYKKLFSKIPAQNLLFMNDVVRKEHESYFHLDFSKSPLVPIMVDVPAQYVPRKNVNKNKIVSVGRLVYFKNYISPLINLLASLRKKGYAFEYHIYGEGELMDEVKTIINKLDAGHYVYLHGRIEYADFNSIVNDALLFVGMGTSIIESSRQGVPGLQAIESCQEDATYGWFFQQQGYEVGEQIAGKKTGSYEPFILQAYTSSEDEYALLCEKSWLRAREFSAEKVMQTYYSVLQNADKKFSFHIPVWKRYMIKLMRQPLKWKPLIKKDYRGR